MATYVNGQIYNIAGGVSSDKIVEATENWLDENVNPATGYAVDKTLTIENAAADAKAVGDLKSALNGQDLIAYESNENRVIHIPNDDWEVGAIEPPTRNDRCRTKNYYPVMAGDTVIIGTNGSHNASINIWYFNKIGETKQSVSNWYSLATNSVSIHKITIESNGFIRFMGSTGTPSDYTDSVIIFRQESNNDKLNTFTHIAESELDFIHEYVITSDVLIKASILNGVLSIADNIVSTLLMIPVKAGDIVYQDTVGTEKISYSVITYSENKTFISGTNYMICPYTVQQNGYVRISFKDANTETPSISTFNGVVKILRRNNYQKQLLNLNNVRCDFFSANDLAIGAYCDVSESYPDGVNYSVNSMRVKKIVPASKGDIVTLNYNLVDMTVVMIDKNNYSRTYSPWIAYAGINSQYPNGSFVVPKDCYVSASFLVRDPSAPWSALSDLTNLLSNYPGIITIYHPINNDDLSVYNKAKWIVRKPKILKRDVVVSQDGCVINGKLWMFHEPSTIRIYDLDTWEYTEKTYDLGHANSVSYNQLCDCLATFGSNGDNQPTIELFKDPENAECILKNAEGYVCINLYNQAEHMNVSGSLCWGEDIMTIYFVDGVYGDTEDINTTNYQTVRNIYKIRLGMGNVDMSADGGFGTFVSGKSDNEYNGTCKIVKTYTGEIVTGRDVYAINNNLPTPQGMEYDGYIYLAWCTQGHNFTVIELDDNSETYRVIKNHMYHDISADGTETVYEPELLALNGSDIIMGSGTVSGTAKYMLNISERLC